VKKNVLDRHRGVGASKHEGVSWDTNGRRWRAAVTVYLGLYEDEDDAAKAVAEWRKEHGLPPPRTKGQKGERGVRHRERNREIVDKIMSDGVPARAVAQEYGLTPQYVNQIVRTTRWWI
jgi:hypothetical protein